MTSIAAAASNGGAMLAIGCLLTTNGLCVVGCAVCPSNIIRTNVAFASASVGTTSARMSRTALVTAFAPKRSTRHLTSSGLGMPHVNMHFRLPSSVGRMRCFKHKPNRGCVSHGTDDFISLCHAATSRVCAGGCIHPRRGKRHASAH